MWTLEGSKASFTCGPLLGCVRLGHLVSGVLGKTWNGQACDAFAILQLAIPLTEDGPRPELVDVYVRGGDLVATYARTPPLTVAPQIYWRLSFAERMQAVAIEVVLSMNTDLLESQPFSAINTVGFECNLFHSSELNAAQ